jgi:hypothetical protein
MALSKAGLVQIGTGVAADTSIIFDGNAIDYRLGIDDSADTFEIGIGSTHATTPQMNFSSSGIVVNEGSSDYDFRVETNGNANMLFISGGNDVVGIGSEGDLGAGLHVKTSDAGAISGGLNTDGDDLVVEHSGSGGISIITGTSSQGGIYFGDSGDADIGVIRYDHSSNSLDFFTNGSEVAMFESSGDLLIGATSGSGKLFVNQAAAEIAVEANCTSASFDANIFNAVSNRDTTNETYNLYRGQNGGGFKFAVRDSGNVENVNNSYGSSSDERIKQNIVDANSQWNDIKALKIRNYKLKTEVAKGVDKTYLGVVAQEVETAGMNGLIGGSTAEDKQTVALSSDFGTLYEDGDSIPEGKAIGDIKTLDQKVKSIKYSILYMKAIKALQEAQTRIETLETKVKTLEDA